MQLIAGISSYGICSEGFGFRSTFTLISYAYKYIYLVEVVSVKQMKANP